MRTGGVPVAVAPSHAGTATIPQPAPITSPAVNWNLPNDAPPAFAEFASWFQDYQSSTLAGESEARGVELARRRRDALKGLIESAPERALALAVPYAVRQSLPASIRAWLEEPVAGRGTLAVVAAIPDPEAAETTSPSTWRTALLGDQVYRAFVYGRRLHDPSMEEVSFHGIAVETSLAVHENPLRVLDADETRLRLLTRQNLTDPVCSVSGLVVTEADDLTVAELDEEPLYLCSATHAAALNEELITQGLAGSNQAVTSEGVLAASAWTEGVKNVIVIRVDFSDLPGEPFSDEAGEAMISGVADFYRVMSYGKTTFERIGQGSFLTPTLRLPQTAAYYGERDASVIRREARSAATAAGYRPGDYTFDLICFGRVPGFSFSGLGYVGIAGAWLRNTSSTGVAAHELGHNFGLNHANYWDTGGVSAIGSGTGVEYGDTFDTMGSANAGGKHFNARYKNYLNWIHSGEVAVASQSGSFRLFAHDDPAAGGFKALRLPKAAGTNYWFEYRANYPGNKWLPNGLGMRWAGNQNQSSLLLDATPGSPSGKDDACILIGRTFSDPAAGWHVTPIARGSAPVPWIDVVVVRGTDPANVAPELNVAASATIGTAGQDLTFTATASDANGDPLAYFWDFGDGNYGGNEPTATHRWALAGEYLVQCTVTDQRGGQARDSVVVRIGSPNTFRLAGRVLAGGAPVPGVRVSASSTRVTYTDSDGSYQLVGLTAGSYSLNAVLEGFTFTHPAFLNPVSVGPSRSGLDFITAPPDGFQSMTLLVAGSSWRYLDDGSDQGTAWREPGFDDARWSEGPAPIGYGDEDIATLVSFGGNSQAKHVTTYFRRNVAVDDPRRIAGLTLGLRRDDGAIVYLNGTEVFRSNMPPGPVNYLTLAPSTTGSADEARFFESDVNPALLQTGANILAVEVHQAARSSSDLVFDLELRATASAAPAPPHLAARWDEGMVRLSWPDGPVSWQLFSSAELGSEAVWRPVEAGSSVAGGVRFVALLPAEGPVFYRLGTP